MERSLKKAEDDNTDLLQRVQALHEQINQSEKEHAQR